MHKLRSDEPLAVELTTVVKAGEFEHLRELLASNPEIASCVVEDAKGGGRTPLHLFAGWPGHHPNAAAIVQTLAEAGTNLDAPAVSMWHKETPLHWAASNDDVALADALLDAGADLNWAAPWSGQTPLDIAEHTGRSDVVTWLLERGATHGKTT